MPPAKKQSQKGKGEPGSRTTHFLRSLDPKTDGRQAGNSQQSSNSQLNPGSSTSAKALASEAVPKNVRIYYERDSDSESDVGDTQSPVGSNTEHADETNAPVRTDDPVVTHQDPPISTDRNPPVPTDQDPPVDAHSLVPRSNDDKEVPRPNDCDDIPRDLDQEKAQELINECRRALHHHSTRMEKANHHLQFLTKCIQLDLYPVGLTFKKNVNAMKGPRSTELKERIDNILKKATVELTAALKSYYGELLQEELQKREAANDHLSAVLRTYPRDEGEQRDFLELLDGRLNRLSNKLSQRRESKELKLKQPRPKSKRPRKWFRQGKPPQRNRARRDPSPRNKERDARPESPPAPTRASSPPARRSPPPPPTRRSPPPPPRQPRGEQTHHAQNPQHLQRPWEPHRPRNSERDVNRPLRDNSRRVPPTQGRDSHAERNQSIERNFVREYGPVRNRVENNDESHRAERTSSQTLRHGPTGPTRESRTQPPAMLPPNPADPLHFQRMGEGQTSPTQWQIYNLLCQLLQLPPRTSNPVSPWY